jgi:hypothetical protein
MRNGSRRVAFFVEDQIRLLRRGGRVEEETGHRSLVCGFEKNLACREPFPRDRASMMQEAAQEEAWPYALPKELAGMGTLGPRYCRPRPGNLRLDG